MAKGQAKDTKAKKFSIQNHVDYESTIKNMVSKDEVKRNYIPRSLIDDMAGLSTVVPGGDTSFFDEQARKDAQRYIDDVFIKKSDVEKLFNERIQNGYIDKETLSKQYVAIDKVNKYFGNNPN